MKYAKTNIHSLNKQLHGARMSESTRHWAYNHYPTSMVHSLTLFSHNKHRNIKVYVLIHSFTYPVQ